METAISPRHFLLSYSALFSFFFVLALSHVSGQTPSSELKFNINVTNPEAKAGQPVMLQMKLENVSDHALMVNTRFLVNHATGPHEIVLLVTGPDQKTLPFTLKIRASFESGTFTRLEPHQSASASYDLTPAFELKQPGEYSVRAYYENKDDPPAQLNLPAAWKGTLESNRVQFKLR
ncbi:MAG TPA: hypothetical protein VI685_29125 [Candidatus Angelobacter sp.]